MERGHHVLPDQPMGQLNKCVHGVYQPEGDQIAFYCSICNPNPVTGPAPILPKSSGDPLALDSTDNPEFCPGCGNMRLYSTESCNVCGFSWGKGAGREQGMANAKQPGTCPTCGSSVHYEFKPGVWDCADCGECYPQPRRKQQ